MQKMKLYNVLFSSIIVSALLPGCIDAKFPIDAKPVTKADPQLLGVWKEEKKTTDDCMYMVTAKDDYHYRIALKCRKEKKAQYPAFLSLIGNTVFLNVEDREDSLKGYKFLRILHVSRDKVQLCAIADSTMQYLNSSADVRERIAKNLNNRAFYKDTGYLVRVK